MVAPLQSGVVILLPALVFLVIVMFLAYLWFSSDAGGGSETERSTGARTEGTFCSNCGVEVDPGDPFCHACGQSLIEETAGKQLCLVCESETDVSDEFCSNCGNPLGA